VESYISDEQRYALTTNIQSNHPSIQTTKV